MGCRIIEKNYVIKQLFHKTFFAFTMPLCLFYTAKLIKPLFTRSLMTSTHLLWNYPFMKIVLILTIE